MTTDDGMDVVVTETPSATIARQAAEIERLQQEKVDILAAKEVTIALPAIPEGFVIDQLRKTITSLYADIARIREEGQKDYEGMREFQRKFIDACHEIERLRGLLRRCEPTVCGDIGEWEQLKRRAGRLHPDAIVVADAKIAAGKTLRDELREALGDD